MGVLPLALQRLGAALCQLAPLAARAEEPFTTRARYWAAPPLANPLYPTQAAAAAATAGAAVVGTGAARLSPALSTTVYQGTKQLLGCWERYHSVRKHFAWQLASQPTT